MTKEEILEGNRLIAEFIQLEMNEFELRFDSSWDWLMSVIDKIEDIGEDQQSSDENYHFFIGKRLVRVVYDWTTYSTFDENSDFSDLERYLNSHKEYRYSIWGTKLETTWQAVVDFIRWYNLKIKTL